MNELMIFESPEFGSIRTVEIGGEPWLVGKDVARALGYKNPRQALSTNVDDEDRGVHSVDSPSGTQQMTIINESGLYSLILSSKLPGAKKFKRWVTSEVLPSIRKTGGYMAPAADTTLADLTAAVQLLTERLDALTANGDTSPFVTLPDPNSECGQVPGIAARRRWMRTVSEKLDLLSARKCLPHNACLSQIYHILEDRWEAVLEDERQKVMERQGLSDCSVLTAIFYNAELKDGFQKILDYNLAPENRGW